VVGTVHGADEIWTGLKQAFTQRAQQSYTEQALVGMGMSAENAALANMALGTLPTA